MSYSSRPWLFNTVKACYRRGLIPGVIAGAMLGMAFSVVGVFLIDITTNGLQTPIIFGAVTGGGVVIFLKLLFGLQPIYDKWQKREAARRGTTSKPTSIIHSEPMVEETDRMEKQFGLDEIK